MMMNFHLGILKYKAHIAVAVPVLQEKKSLLMEYP
jgi:hypothetical protein